MTTCTCGRTGHTGARWRFKEADEARGYMVTKEQVRELTRKVRELTDDLDAFAGADKEGAADLDALKQYLVLQRAIVRLQAVAGVIIGTGTILQRLVTKGGESEG